MEAVVRQATQRTLAQQADQAVVAAAALEMETAQEATARQVKETLVVAAEATTVTTEEPEAETPQQVQHQQEQSPETVAPASRAPSQERHFRMPEVVAAEPTTAERLVQVVQESAVLAVQQEETTLGTQHHQPTEVAVAAELRPSAHSTLVEQDPAES